MDISFEIELKEQSGSCNLMANDPQFAVQKVSSFEKFPTHILGLNSAGHATILKLLRQRYGASGSRKNSIMELTHQIKLYCNNKQLALKPVRLSRQYCRVPSSGIERNVEVLALGGIKTGGMYILTSFGTKWSSPA